MSLTWKIELHPEIVGTHQWSILSGLARLKSDGVVSVAFERLRPTDARASVTSRVTDAGTGRQLLVSFEMHDGAEIDAWNANNVDVIFKRSFLPGSSVSGRSTSEILPLGLTLGCVQRGAAGLALAGLAHRAFDRSRHPNIAEMQRILASARGAVGAGFTSMLEKHLAYPYVTIDELESLRPPEITQPYVTFLVRAWDPSAASERSKAMFEEITLSRARLIRRLRRRFGERFIGGFVPTDYTRGRFGDCVAQISTAQRDFLRTVAHGGIGLSTRGLADSNPWKLAEYLAVGSAIVTEPLRFQLPEPLGVGINVLEFDNEDMCVEQCQMLFDDRALLGRMQQENLRYWLEYVRPDRLIHRRLHQLFDQR